MKGLAACLVFVCGVGPSMAQPADRLLLQRPALSQTRIVFVPGPIIANCFLRRRLT